MATVSPTRRRPHSLMSPHETRYLMMKGGKTPEEIAAMEGVKLETVEKSIAMVQGARAANTVPEMQLRQIEVVNASSPIEKEALAQALQAEIIEYDAQGKVIGRRPDHEIRLKASAIITQKVGELTPKAKGNIVVGVNTAPTNVTQAPSASSATPIRRFEDIVREINYKRQAQLTNGENSAIEGTVVIDGEDGDSGTAR